MQKREAIMQRAAARELGRAAVAPAGLAERIRAARTLARAIRWPGTDIDIGLRVLSRSRLVEAQAAAVAGLKARGIDESKIAHAEMVGAEYSVQILARALYESTAPDALLLFATAADFDETATADELHALLDEYHDLRRSVDPELEELPAELWNEFLEAVKKKDETRSKRIASDMPRPWLLSLVGRLSSSLASTLPSTDSSSEPPSESAVEPSSGSEVPA